MKSLSIFFCCFLSLFLYFCCFCSLLYKNKHTNKQTNKKRNREKTENVTSPFICPSSLLNYRRTVNVDNCKFFEDKDFVFSTKAIP